MFFQKVAAAEDADDSSAGSNYAGSVDGDAAALSDDSAPSDNEPGGPSTSKPLVKVISAFYF